MEFSIRQAEINDCNVINQCIKSAFSEYIAVLNGRPAALDTNFNRWLVKTKFTLQLKITLFLL